MRFAYADPPYVGYAKYYKDHEDFDGEVDHAKLINTLVQDFPDGWALSCHSPSLKDILAMCPEGVRVLAWVKPFASWKPSVRLAYTWEPVVFFWRKEEDQETEHGEGPHILQHYPQEGSCGREASRLLYLAFQRT